MPLDPRRAHVFLYGNLAEVGAPGTTSEGMWQYPSPRGMVEILEALGFVPDERTRRGNLHFESYR